MGRTQPVVVDGAGENSGASHRVAHKFGLFSSGNSAFGRLPDFIAVGPPRTGTTWLHTVLRGHVTLPERVKETYFFKRQYWRGIDWYASHFRTDTGLPAGEFGPSYFSPEVVRERIKRHIPDCRIICTFRDPADRLYSSYQLWRRRGVLKYSFDRVALTDREMTSYAYYGRHLRGFIDLFGRDNVLVLIHEDIRSDRQGYLDKVCSFIGIPLLDANSAGGIERRIHHVEYAPKRRKIAKTIRKFRARLADYRLYRTEALLEPLFELAVGRGERFPPLDPEMRAKIKAHFRPEIETLEEIIGRDLSAWK
jgi:hypothetical protein